MYVFNLVDADTMRFLMRLVVILILFACCVVIKLIAITIKNERFEGLVNRTLYFFIFNVVARLIASFADKWLSFEIAWISSLINYGFYLYIFYLLLKLLFRLRSDKETLHTSTGVVPNTKFINKSRLTHNLDELFDIINFVIRQTKKLEQQVKNHLT